VNHDVEPSLANGKGDGLLLHGLRYGVESHKEQAHEETATVLLVLSNLF
jgi:hypothetical protein